MWILVVWQISFSQPMIKTRFDSEEQCLRTGAFFEVAYRESKHIEFKCFKVEE